MLFEYLNAAMTKAHYELIEDEKPYFGEIPGLDGVWASASTLEDCRQELVSALEDWLLFSIAQHLEIPEMDGKRITLPERVA